MTYIGPVAFMGCDKLKYVNIPNIETIDIYAFADCKLLSSVTLGETTQPILKGNVFLGSTPSNFTIYVPPAYVASYEAAWKGNNANFNNNGANLNILPAWY